MTGERIAVRFVEVCGSTPTPNLQLIGADATSPDLMNFEEIEQKFRQLAESSEHTRQIAVFWDATSSIIACEAIKDSHRPRELIWLHRGLAEHMGQHEPKVH